MMEETVTNKGADCMLAGDSEME